MQPMKEGWKTNQIHNGAVRCVRAHADTDMESIDQLDKKLESIRESVQHAVSVAACASTSLLTDFSQVFWPCWKPRLEYPSYTL